MAVLKDVKRLVVKVGTSTLVYDNGKTNIRRMHKLISVLSDIENSGIKVTLVSSGAIGVGTGKLGLPERPKDTPGRQAASTVGQCELMYMYDKMFSEYGHKIGQLLFTKSDVESPERRKNLINTFDKLFSYGAIQDILLEQFGEVGIYTGPWTSGKITKGESNGSQCGTKGAA